MKEKLNTIFSETGCPSEGILQEYLNGNLSHTEKHQVEKHLIDCEMCSDELEGLRLMNNKNELNAAIERINNKIDRKLEKQKIKLFYGFEKIAAAILIFVAIGALFILFNHKNNLSTEKFVAENTKPSSVEQEKDASKIDTFKKESTSAQTVETRKLLAQDKPVSVIKEKNATSFSEITETEGEGEVQIETTIADRIYEPSENNINSTALAYVETQETINDKINRNEDETESDIPDKQAEEYTGGIATGSNIKEDGTVPKTEDLTLNTAVDSYAINRSVSKKSSRRKSKDAPMVSQSIQDDGSNVQTNEDLLNVAIDDYTTEKYADAITKLEKILQYKDSAYFQKAQWYYALTLIELDKVKKAKQLLIEIANTPEHPFAEKAHQKIKELED